MDLLDYGSSDDENGDGGDKNKTPAVVPPAATASILKNKLPPPKKKQENKKGKKILSLQAVLPAHILEQLTQSQVRGDDDDDEEEDDDGWNKMKKNSASTTKQSTGTSGNDAGIDSFLSELHQSAPVATKTSSQKAAPTKLGAAFLSSTTVVTTQKAGAVRDIHGEQPVQQEAEATTVSEIPAPKDESKSSLLSSLPRPTRKIHPTVAARPIVAAPPVSNTAQAATSPSDLAAPSGNKKRRRQEMERLLRQGQLDAALDQSSASSGTNTNSVAANTISLQQPQAYVPTDGAAAHVDTTGLVRVAPTPMYDPRQGQAVVGTGGGAGRGKNQINHLLASAANLELARARGMVAKPGGQNPHRANAKRKYGW